MKVLIGISHPKQVHMFKNLIYELNNDADQYFVVVNEKEICTRLLKSYSIYYHKIGTNQKGVARKLLQLPILTAKTLSFSLKFKPDIIVGQALPYLAYTSFLLKKPFIIFEDTESASMLHKIVNPFANFIITPESFTKCFGKNHLKIKSGYELAYLHANNFQPEDKIYGHLGLKRNDKFVIVRFVSWNASHDIGHSGLSLATKIDAVFEFEKYAKVFISSEDHLPGILEPYRFSIPPELMHSAIYYSELVYGESATMAAEAAYLGTPAIFLDNEGRGYTDALEKKYKLVFNFSEGSEDQKMSIKKGVEILSEGDSMIWEKYHGKLVGDSIDVNAFMIWFLRNYPLSTNILKTNDDYQNRFAYINNRK